MHRYNLPYSARRSRSAGKQGRPSGTVGGKAQGAKWINHAEGIKISLRPRLKGRGRTIAMRVRARAEETLDGAECRICLRKMTQLTSHITRVHGMSCAEYRDKYGADAPLMDRDHLTQWVATSTATARLRHERNTGTCARCGNDFQLGREVTRVNRRRYCSDECKSAQMRDDRSTPEYIAALVRNVTFSGPRLQYLQKMKADKEARHQHVCCICEKPFRSARQKLVASVCSYACRSERMKRKKASL